MSDKKVNRKDFFKIAGTAGVGAAMTYLGCKEKKEGEPGSAEAGEKYPDVPVRSLGKSGLKVPVLSHGIMYNLVENQIVLRKAMKWGINYWDTSHSYAGGNSELGIGKYLKRHPKKRKDIIIATKASGAENSREVEKCLQTSFKRMNTNYIDIFYGVHGMSDPSELTEDLRKWAEKAKKRGVIKTFGFTTHRNMAKCLKAAAKLDWIDVIMTSYNFRLMQDKEMLEAVDACAKKGIGLVSMKVMGHDISSSGDKKLTRHFLSKGYTEGQAKLKAVLGDERFASACITMENTALITTNAAAALDKVKLSGKDMDVLDDYARLSCSGYCAGCGYICDEALPDTPVISDVMRYLMYYNSYGDEAKARQLFKEIPYPIRRKLAAADFTGAEARCPQRLPIGNFVKEAFEKLS